MAVSPFEIIAAPATVYVAPVGETYPVIDADPAGKWVSLGETEGGVTVAHQHNVVELRTDRARNVALHREAWARVDSALRDAEAESTPPATAGAR